MRTVKIPLPSAMQTPTGVIHEIILREPTFEEYFQNGDPYEVAETPGEVRYTVQSPDVISAYLDVCLVQPKDRGLLDKLGVVIAKKVRAEILGFFQPVAAEGQVSQNSPKSSSSPADSTPAA